MNEQTRAAAMTAPEDAWDRLAALAFGDTVSAGGCSVHAHDCTCLAEEHASAGVAWSAHDAAAPDSPDFSASDTADSFGTSDDSAHIDHVVPPPPVLPDAERPVYPDSEPEATPPLEPEPEEDHDFAD
jgi:hypothetical protein